ncbi:hypothetical protein BDZ94DRAFT_650902 [Collybia nuda]|uniref:Uncharacterized protein n=1 Tax=Collybia nuda TaxID=64659 RepID=A0A9P6CJR0_9AGAR|nr:hypothetical protein BDZ94DRAFT_650902 [Collybia nuda]
MDLLRKRIPFKLTDSPTVLSEVGDPILDEQEELIQGLREANVISNGWHLALLRIVLGLSFSLQLISLVHSPHKNPFLVMFPVESTEVLPSIPYPVLATLLSMAIHINLAFLAFPGDLQTPLRFWDFGVFPVSYQFLYIAAAVPPTLSLFLQLPWQSTAWWSVTVAVVFIVRTVTGSIDYGNEGITELETMQYVAPGA